MKEPKDGLWGVMNLKLSEIKEKLSKQLPTLSKQYQVKSLSVFGSYVRQEQSSESDLDILIEYEDVPGLIRYIELENYLSDLLGVKVDLVIKNTLKPRIAKRVLDEAVEI
ncbi:MAG: nucleotidyltransferase family protein [Desulfobacterales bacterium]|nr:nucleotidyltransferase family protein [Desulfobacterales bacterium]